MRHQAAIFALTVLGLSWAATDGYAQSGTYGDPLARPTVSPYLNLLRGDAGSTLPNYYTLVRPQLQARAAAQQQQASIQQLEKRFTASQRTGRTTGVSSEIRSTGHSTQFMNYSHYYSRR